MRVLRKHTVFWALVLLIISSCTKTLKHERYIYNKSADTIIVLNPDYAVVGDTILPAQKQLIFSYEVLDTKQQNERCAWEGDTLLIYRLDTTYIKRSVKVESFWTTKLIGDKNRSQVCTFIIVEDDF